MVKEKAHFLEDSWSQSTTTLTGIYLKGASGFRGISEAMSKTWLHSVGPHGGTQEIDKWFHTILKTRTVKTKATSRTLLTLGADILQLWLEMETFKWYYLLKFFATSGINLDALKFQ